MTELNTSLFGVGLYTLADASRFTSLERGTINRLVSGYKNGRKYYDPLIALPFSEFEFEQKIISFRALVEIQALAALNKKGLNIISLKKASRRLQSEFGAFPFSSRDLDLHRDGHTFFCGYKSHLNFGKIIKQSLKDVDYDRDEPSKWWIAGKDKGIVMDPHRSFGRPIDSESGILAEVLYDSVLSYGVENGFTATATDYDLSELSVKHAFAFQKSLTPDALSIC